MKQFGRVLKSIVCIYNAEQNTWGLKKCEAKKNQQLKVLISTKAKKSVNESAT